MATFYQTFTSDSSPPKLYIGLVAKGKSLAFAKFKNLFHKSAFLHLTFSLFILSQFFLSGFLYLTGAKSLYTPIAFSLLFLTISSYALIAYYQKNRKLDSMEKIAKDFLHYCTLHLSKNIEDREKLHLAIAESIRDFAQALHNQELFYLNIYPFKFSKNHIISYFLYFHYNDILYLQEKLLDICLDLHSKVLEDCACSLQFHSSLSKTYTALSNCYKKPSGRHLEKAFKFSNFTKFKELMERQINYYTLAEEELFIVCELSQNETWTHLDLASFYAQFDQTEKEMKQYEILIDQISDDKEVMYKLGILYFKHLKTSKGLKIYSKLRKLDALYAKNLLSHYNAL
jgi:hypothetical protein